MTQTCVMTKQAVSVVDAGRQAGCRFRIWDGRWEKTPVSNFPNIPELVKRFEIVKMNAKIARLYIADEPEPEIKSPKDLLDFNLPQIKLPEINLPWKEIGNAALVAGKVVAIGTAAVTAAVTILPVVAVVGLFAMLDPAYLVELDTGEIIEIYSDTRKHK